MTDDDLELGGKCPSGSDLVLDLLGDFRPRLFVDTPPPLLVWPFLFWLLFFNVLLRATGDKWRMSFSMGDQYETDNAITTEDGLRGCYEAACEAARSSTQRNLWHFCLHCTETTNNYTIYGTFLPQN